MSQARHRTRLPLIQPATVHVRRSYADCRFGQIHVLTAYPSGGGFDERTPLLCLHHARGSGQVFAPILRELGLDRSVYAPDLPGHGSSDAPGKYSVTEVAGAIGDFLDTMRFRTVDLCGYQLGAQLAIELAIARPQQVRRVMLWGVPMFAPQERTASLTRLHADVASESAELVADWQRLRSAHGVGVAHEVLASEFADRLRSGAHGMSAESAVLEYAASERLGALRQPTLVLRVHDEFWEHAPRVRSALPNGAILELPEHGQAFLSSAPHRFVTVAKDFFDR